MNKIEFKDLPDTTTPFTASLFNQMQDNIEEAIDLINAYSTIETVIGNYNNKPLYRKTFVGQYTSSTSRVIIDLVTNVDKIKDSYGLYSPNSTIPNVTLGQPTISTGGSIDAYSSTRINNNIAQICFNTPQTAYSGSTGSYEITLEYTKTTD